MGYTTADHISRPSPSILNPPIGISKLLACLLLTLGSLQCARGAPTDAAADEAIRIRSASDATWEAESADPHGLWLRDPTTAAAADDDSNASAAPVEKREAGLFWGPVYIGNLKLYLTNPHVGYAGPKFPDANHVNFHVDKQAPKNKYTAVVNLHIVKYTSGGKSCLYAWDSVTKKTVFDSCFDDFGNAIAEAVSAAKNFVDDLLRAADFFASIVIIAALAFALASLLASLGAVALA